MVHIEKLGFEMKLSRNQLNYYWFFLGIADSASDEPYEQFEDENRDIDNAKEALLQVILISFSEIGKRFR